MWCFLNFPCHFLGAVLPAGRSCTLSIPEEGCPLATIRTSHYTKKKKRKRKKEKKERKTKNKKTKTKQTKNPLKQTICAFAKTNDLHVQCRPRIHVSLPLYRFWAYRTASSYKPSQKRPIIRLVRSGAGMIIQLKDAKWSDFVKMEPIFAGLKILFGLVITPRSGKLRAHNWVFFAHRP